MDTDSWHCWGYTESSGHTDHQCPDDHVTAREERNADNRHFPVYM
ncbi:unnamed protein product [Staurois parvus]|uniref:Uncharacterized protein n=1 Tax=Staurois parvus TaxID=386267 RepID=A0ABN9BSV1_9NEOB|nr:unnamed protein product [Staurois parvus]